MREFVTVVAPVSFKAWAAPNFAQPAQAPRPRQEGLRGTADGVAVADLTPAVLDALAGAWLEDLYGKAGRPCPFKPDSAEGR